MRLRFSAAAVAAFLFAVAAFADNSTPANEAEAIREAIKSQLPMPPDGFEWQIFKNAVFPKPAKWQQGEKSTVSGGIPMNVYAISPEEFSDTKQFEIGFTVQIISGSQRTRSIEANKMALLYLKPFFDTHKKEDVLILDRGSKGDFERTFFRFRDAPPGLKPIIVHKFIIANNSADSVHVFTFESPADTWEDNWEKYGTPILSKINVLPNVPSN